VRDDITTLFHESTPPSMSVDPYAVLAGGRRRRRRRAAVTGSALTALAAVAVVVAVGGLGSGGPSALPADGSHPAKPVTTTLGGKEPMLGSDGRPISGPSRFAVEIDPSRPDNLGYYVVEDSGKRTLIARSSVALPTASTNADAPAVTWGTGSAVPHVVIGVMPTTATQWILLNPDASSASHSDQAPLGATGLQAFVSVYDNTTDATKATGLVWRDESGRVWDQSGVVPSAGLSAAVVGFVDPRLSVWGAFTSTGSMSAPIPTTVKPQLSWSGGDRNTPAVYIGMVPLRATDPTAAFGAGCTHRVGPTLTPAGDGAHAFLYASCRPPSSSVKAITGLSITVDGKTVRSS
jgi:hypothetical protein